MDEERFVDLCIQLLMEREMDEDDMKDEDHRNLDGDNEPDQSLSADERNTSKG